MKSKTSDQLPIIGHQFDEKQIVQERWKRIKAGDLSFLGYNQPKQSIIKRIWNKIRKAV